MTVSYVYNPDGSRQSMTTPAGTYSYTYDNAGRLTNVSFPWGQSVTYAYDNANRLTGQTQSKFTTTYAYDGLDNLLALNQISNDASHTTLANFTGMTYDAVGNRLGMTMTIQTATVYNTVDASGVCVWTYDTQGQQDQLTSDGQSRNSMPGFNGYSEAYQSDVADNLIVMRGGGQTYNADNQLMSGGSAYDGNGNTPGYTYDANDHTGGGYREDGLRAWKQGSGGYSSRVYYLYDGTHVVYELGVNGYPASYGYGATGLVQRATLVNKTNYYTAYTFDPMGNVVSRFPDTYPLNVPQDFSVYDAFGYRRAYYYPNSPNTTTPPDPVGYGGQWGNYTDVDTGLILMTFRHYDPSRCRFLTRDPMGYEGGINLYAYCRNNPINRFDPLGLDWVLGPADNPWLVFTAKGTKQGLKTGLAVAADTYTGGLYSSKAYKNEPGYDGANTLSLISREAALTAATMGASKALAARRLAAAARARTTRVLAPILKDVSPAAKICDETGTIMEFELSEAGIGYERVVVEASKKELSTNPGLLRRLLGQKPEVYSTTGKHYAVKVQGRVYDAITGAKGLSYCPRLHPPRPRASRWWERHSPLKSRRAKPEFTTRCARETETQRVHREKKRDEKEKKRRGMKRRHLKSRSFIPLLFLIPYHLPLIWERRGRFVFPGRCRKWPTRYP